MEHVVVIKKPAASRRCRMLGAAAVVISLSLTACSSGTTTAASSTTAAARSPAVSSSLAFTEPDGVPWTYSGATGPENWGSIAAGCDPGPTGSQSPIDIETATLADETPATAGAVTISYLPTVFEVENTGRTIEGVPGDLHANFITIDGKKFYLQQFHLHNPSEHTLDNASFGMELHLVNKSDDGALAVLGVLMNTGEENSPLAELFSKMPTSKTDESSMVALDEKIDPTDVLPVGSKVARYSGSLTTPPCTEPVIWSVYLTPSSVSAKQLDALGAIFPGNHRPTQPLNGRVVNEVQTD
jgi:carbonic anhydrase